MANNRITYATAQLAIKDNALPSGSHVMGFYSGAVVNSASVLSTDVNFNVSGVNGAGDVSGHWPQTGVLIVKASGTNLREYIKFSGVGTNTTYSAIYVEERGAFGTTAAPITSGTLIEVAGWEVPLGVQSASISTNFSLEDVFTLGQLDAYENVEGIPEIEVTIERVLDGTKPLWMMVTDANYSDLKGSTASYKSDLAVSIYPDTQSSASGTPDSTVTCSGMVINSYSISMGTDGNFTESVTLEGTDKTWGTTEGVPTSVFQTSSSYDAAVDGSGVQRAENFDLVNSQVATGVVPNIDCIQSLDVSVDIGREDIFRLGQKTAFFKSVSFPITVETTIELITAEGDKINALGNSDNLSDQSIVLKTQSGLTINLGSKNKVSSVEFAGFDTGGGNGTVTLTLQNSNSLSLTHSSFNAFIPNRVQK